MAGIANEHSIAYGCARAFRDAGAELAVTYLNEKAKPFVEPIARGLGAELVLPLDVRDQSQMSAVFEAIRASWGRLDFVLHSIAFAPKADLQGRLVDSSVEGFLSAVDISCHSFVRMAGLAVLGGARHGEGALELGVGYPGPLSHRLRRARHDLLAVASPCGDDLPIEAPSDGCYRWHR